MQYNLSVSYTNGYNARPRTRRSRTDRVIPTRLTHSASNPLTECRVAGCHSVTTVGPLCLAHWEEKVNSQGSSRGQGHQAAFDSSRAKLAPTAAAKKTPKTKRYLVVLASGPAPSPAARGRNSSGPAYTRRWVNLPE